MRLDATAGVCLAFLCAFRTLIALLSLQYSLNHLKIHIIDFTIHDYPTVVISAPNEVSVVLSRPSLAAPDPKRGSGETVYKKFELWNVYWMTFTCYVGTLFTSQHPFNQIRLQHHQTNSATLFIQH